MLVILGFAVFLLYVFCSVKLAELSINKSFAVFITGMFAYLIGVPLLALVLFGAK